MSSSPLVDSNDETGFRGYTVLDDGTLQPSLDDHGNVVNPDVVAMPFLVCARCAIIIRKTFSLYYDRFIMQNEHHFDPLPFYESKRQFQQSVLQGCHLCSLLWMGHARYLWESGTAGKNDPSDSLLASATVFCVEDIPNTLRLKFLYSNGSTNKGLGISKVARDDKSKLDGLAVQAKYSFSNASKATWEVATSWLSKCLSDHEDCHDAQNSVTRPPTRLVDVGENQHSILRIVYPESHVRWLSVSHCWGEAHEDVLQLTKNNLERMCSGFSEEELPPLFRDCVNVARKLHVRFLWIDSLCIIQGSEEDWTLEASRMGDVYRGAYCSIAAVSAPDSHASIFTKSHPLIREQCTFGDKSDDPDTYIGYQAFGTGWEPLYTRAWVMQERLLAPRTLEYTNTGIGWRCGFGSFRLDDGLLDLPAMDVSRTWNDLLSRRIDELSDHGCRYAQGLWTWILNKYNSTKLSYETDRPYALKGIISTLAQQTGLTFVAGVCLDFLPASLLWRLETCYTYEKWISSLRNSPSWSCAFRHKYVNMGTISPGIPYAEVEIIQSTVPVLRVRGMHLGSVSIQRVSGSDEVRLVQSNTTSPVCQTLYSQWVKIEHFLPRLDLRFSLDFVLGEPLVVKPVLLLLLEEVGAEEEEEEEVEEKEVEEEKEEEEKEEEEDVDEEKVEEEEAKEEQVRYTAVGILVSKIDDDNDMWVRVGMFCLGGRGLNREELIACFQEEEEYVLR